MAAILIATSSLRSGGAERVVTQLANHWAAHGHRVAIASWDRPENDFYVVNQCIKRRGAGLLAESPTLAAKLLQNVRRLLWLRRVIRHMAPDVIVSFVDQMNIMTLLASVGIGVPIIVSERIDPRIHQIPRIWQWLRALIYRRSTALVVQTSRVADWARQYCAAAKIHVIPNSVPLSVLENSAIASREVEGSVLGVGRLHRQKGFDLLIRAFAESGAGKKGWTLTLAGDGPEREALQALAGSCGIADRLVMPGVVREIDALYSKACIFVLSSRYEGFPNVLLEAMASGCACISFDCPSGPREIIVDGRNGVLVPCGDVQALAQVIRELVSNPSKRSSLGESARGVRETFSPGCVHAQWDQLIETIAA